MPPTPVGPYWSNLAGPFGDYLEPSWTYLWPSWAIVGFVRWGRRKISCGMVRKWRSCVEVEEKCSGSKQLRTPKIITKTMFFSECPCRFAYFYILDNPENQTSTRFWLKKPVVLDHVSRRQQTKYISRSSKFEVWFNFLGTASAIDTPKLWMMMAMGKKTEQGKTTKRRRSEGDSSPKWISIDAVT